MEPLIDPFGRRVTDLRLSITDRCNFRCTYCMPQEGMPWLDRSEVLTYEEQARIVRVVRGALRVRIGTYHRAASRRSGRTFPA